MEESDYLNLSQLSIQGDISLQHIIDIEIKREINKHTELTVIGIIDENDKDSYLDKINYGAEINLKYGEEITDTLFGGIIVEAELKEYKRSYYVVIKAKSATWITDQKLKKRSFNKETVTYEDILKVIENDYKGCDFIPDDKAAQQADKLIVQYDETDFEFLKRIASHLGLVVIPEDLFNLPRFYFGISTRNSIELNKEDYKLIRYFDNFTEEKYEYKLITGQALEIGCEVILDNYRFIVVKVESKLEDSQLKHTYTILERHLIEVPRVCNENIRGTAIEGTVIEAKGTKVKVQLDIDNEGVTNWYDFIVGSNNSLYSMPYEGDKVKVYFQSNEEEESSVSFTTYSGGEGLNPDTKFWSNQDGKKIEYTPQSIEISAKSGTLNSIKLTDSSGIDIKSGLKITIRSLGSLSLNANSISIVGSTAVSLNHYPDPKGKNTGIPKGITIDSTDVSFKVEDAHFEGKEKKAYPIEAEPEPAFSEAPKPKEPQQTQKYTLKNKNEERVESGWKTFAKGLGLAALAVGMVAATVVTGGAALAVAGTLLEGGIISTALGVGVATAAGVGMTMGVAGATMEGNVAEATMEEGINEVNNGENGIDEKGYNRIRDGEFGGDEEKYQQYQDQAMGLWETGVMINMTAASVGTELLPAAGVADMYLGSKFPNVLSEDENIINNNPMINKIGDSNNDIDRNSLTKEQITNNLDGVTDKSTEIANYIRDGKIKVNTISSELYDRYYDKDVTAHCEMSSNGDVHIYVRKDSDTLYEDIVHESTHAIDMYDRFGYEETQTTQSWEYRAYSAERDYQRATGSIVKYPSDQSIYNHIQNEYENANEKFDPYFYLRRSGNNIK